jgi:hypothetical protein
MRRIALLLIWLAMVASACGGAPAPVGDNDAADRTSAIYAAVVRQLVTEDHTFGSGTSPFKRVFIVDGVVDNAANPTSRPRASKPFDAALEDAIAERLAGLPPVEFVKDPGSVLVGQERCQVRGDGALISLGPIEGDHGRATVPNGLYFACLGGQWSTYVVERVDGQWTVQGTTNGRAIA